MKNLLYLTDNLRAVIQFNHVRLSRWGNKTDQQNEKPKKENRGMTRTVLLLRIYFFLDKLMTWPLLHLLDGHTFKPIMMDIHLRERDLDPLLVKGLLNGLSNTEEDTPIICRITPGSHNQIDR